MLTVSNDKPYKNVRVLLEAFRNTELADKADLVLVGPKDGLARLAADVGVDAKTPGFVSEDEYRTAHRRRGGVCISFACRRLWLATHRGHGRRAFPTLVTDIEPMCSDLPAPAPRRFLPMTATHSQPSCAVCSMMKPGTRSVPPRRAPTAATFRWADTARETLAVL